ncbi:TPA: hypothetical protein ACKQB7_003170 [Serratia marcescens]
MRTKIEQCQKKIDQFDWGYLDILAEYLYSKRLIASFDDKTSMFYKVINIFRNSDYETQEALKFYVMFRKYKLVAEGK